MSAPKFSNRPLLPRSGASQPLKPMSSTPAPKKLLESVKSAAKGKEEKVAKVRCPGCQNEYKLETIQKTGQGICTRCIKKKQAGGATSKSKMERCKGTCNKDWTHATLIKYKDENGKATGMCKKCHDSRNTGPVMKYTTCICSVSDKCCGDKLNTVTAGKYNSICMPCIQELSKSWAAEVYEALQVGEEQTEEQTEEQAEEQADE